MSRSVDGEFAIAPTAKDFVAPLVDYFIKFSRNKLNDMVVVIVIEFSTAKIDDMILIADLLGGDGVGI